MCKYGDFFLKLEIAEHLQSSFDWEANKDIEISSATIETINSIVLED